MPELQQFVPTPDQLVLAESSPDPILTIDEDSTILYANPASEHVFGYGCGELVGQSLLLLIPEPFRQSHSQGIETYVATGERPISWQGLRVPILAKSGAEIPVEISFGEFDSGGRRLFSGFLRDVSDRVAAEDALAALNRRLQAQTVLLAQRVEEAQALSEDLAQTSHDAEDRAFLASLAAERARRLLSLSTRLNSAVGTSEVADLILESGMEAAGAAAGSLALVQDDSVSRRTGGREFEVIRTRGFTDELTAEYRRFAIHAGRPLADAVLNKNPVLISSSKSARERYPSVPPLGYEGFAALPVIASGESIAAIALSFSNVQDFDESAETFLRTIAEQCAQALERARLYDAMDRQAARSGFLADASRILTSSLDYEGTLVSLVEAAVPVLGDWCAVDIVDDPSSSVWPPKMTRLAVAHIDPHKKALGLTLEERFPTDWNSHAGMAAVMRDGSAQFIPVLADDMLARASRSPEHLLAPQALKFSSVIMVPLIARGTKLGVLTLVMGDSGRSYGTDDVALASDLAVRAATAIDNARLFRDARQARIVAESATARAALASAAKSNFLATMSHEIRTPINAVLGYSELLALELAGPLTVEQKAQVERIRVSTAHLLSLVNEVLDLAKIESGTMRVEIRECVAGEAVNASLELVGLQAAAKGVRMDDRCEGACSALYLGDEDRVRQILVNLLANAVKFTDRGGSVSVQCAVVDDPPFGGTRRWHGRHLAFRVRDTGVGIPTDQYDRIFEAFVQAGSVTGNPYTREQAGTGLGLAISRQLAHQMRGEITVASQVGAGSSFTLYLPAADSLGGSTGG